MGKPTDQDVTATEKSACHLEFSREGAYLTMEGHMQKHKVDVAEGGEGKHGPETLLWFWWEGGGRAG
jgi:hypothetical protein